MKTLISDLVNSKSLRDENYNYLHYDSKDERGIDVALLYKPTIFTVEHSESFSVYLQNDIGQQDYTRDILLVKGKLKNENLNIIVNHWSSRRAGKQETEFKRLAAANVVISIIKRLKKENPTNKTMVMGDFNDNPDYKSCYWKKKVTFITLLKWFGLRIMEV